MKSKHNIFISVIIPIYNSQKYIDECLNSIIRQTLNNYEVIMIDDGSTDFSTDICLKYQNKDSRFKYYKKENEGAALARNYGTKLANGEFIFYIDSDDYIEDNLFELLYKNYEVYNSDIICFGHDMINDNKKVLMKKMVELDKDYYDISEIRNHIIPNMISCYPKEKNYNLTFSRMMIIKRKVIDKLKWEFLSEREYESEDVISMVSLIYNCNSLSIIKSCLYHYRYNTISLSHSFNKNSIAKNEKMLRYFENSLDKEIYSKYSDRFIYLYFSYVIIMIKNIINSNEKYRIKRSNIKLVSNNPYLKLQIKTSNKLNISVFRRLFFLSIYCRLYSIVYFMGSIKNR